MAGFGVSLAAALVAAGVNGDLFCPTPLFPSALLQRHDGWSGRRTGRGLTASSDS